MTLQDEYDEYNRGQLARWLLSLGVLSAGFLLAAYFVRAKVRNDSAIARDTERAAVALERIADSVTIEAKISDAKKAPPLAPRRGWALACWRNMQPGAPLEACRP